MDTRRVLATLVAACIATSCNGARGAHDSGAPGSDAARTADDGVRPSDGAVPDATCTPPIALADVSHPDHVVGTGTAASCTEAALVAAAGAGGVITFDCGGAATITVTHEVTLLADHDTVLDGGGVITLDGGGATRILHYQSGDYRGNYGGPQHTVTLQRITLANGRSTGTMVMVPDGAPSACSRGYSTDAGGGAVLVVSGKVHVIDAVFTGNQGATPGPDVAGGAIYAIGSSDATIVGSQFIGNSGSNGGAVGMLNSDLSLVNDSFTSNHAVGTGENTIDTTMCPASINGGEVGGGGSGGAVSIDGGDDGDDHFCGNVFADNTANALGGALFRTPDGAPRLIEFDRCTLDGNTSMTGAGAMYIHNSTLRIVASTLSNNSAPTGGAIQADGTTLDFTNATFAGNRALHGLGGAVALFGNGGTLTNCTFADNHSDGGSGLFAAAIAGGASLTIQNTLFANNTSQDCGAPMACQDNGTGAHDVQWPQNHIVCANADAPCVAGITFADPMLGALGDHGGPTQTLATSAPDGVVQVGTGCPATDQAGHPRGAPCTLGALEK